METVKAITGLQNTHDQFLNLPQIFCFALGILIESLICQLGKIMLVCSPHKVHGVYQFPTQILPTFRYLTTTPKVPLKSMQRDRCCESETNLLRELWFSLERFTSYLT